MRRFVRIAVGLLIVAGCTDTSPPAQEYSHLSPLDAQETLNAQFVSKDRLHFLAWDGQNVGSDCDAELVLFADGAAKFIRYGYAIVLSQGTYSMDGTAIQLAGRELQDWSPLQIKRDGQDLLLVPTESTNVIGFNGKAWPLRTHAGFEWAEYYY